MEKKIKIDVSNVVAKVKEQNLLFYPAMIYIFAKALNMCSTKSFSPAYLNSNQNNVCSMISQNFDNSFEFFFNQYVKNCFYNQSSCSHKNNLVLFSYLSSEETAKMGLKLPTFFIEQLENIDDKTFLSFHTREISVNEKFLSICRNLCNSF